MRRIKPKIKISWLLIAAVLIIGIIAVTFTHFDAPFYQRPIAKVMSVKNEKRVPQTDEFHNQDYLQNQKLTLKMQNGKDRGKTVTATNQFSGANATDLQYHPGQEIFVHLSNQNLSKATVLINGFKRDTAVVFLIWLTMSLLLIILKFRGSMALLSIVINACLFFLAVAIDVHTSFNPFVLFSILAVVFTIVTAFLIFGITKETVVSISATLLGTAAAILIAFIVISTTHAHGMYFEMMDYVTQNRMPIYYAGSMIGSLGAIMDLSADITSSLFAVHQEDPGLSFVQLLKNGRKIGSSIMGPLINVLFLIFVAGTFPMMLLFLRNGNSWGYSFSMIMSLGIVQSLISAIGITITVPITSLIASCLCESKVVR